MTLSQLESIRAARLQLLDHGDTQAASLLDWAVTAEPDDWRPIEEAPGDGTVIWAFNGEQGRMKLLSGDGVMEGNEAWALWVWDDELLSDIDPEPIQPTHFKALPKPPAA